MLGHNRRHDHRPTLEESTGELWRAVLVGLGLFGTDLGTHDSVEVAMQLVEGRWDGLG